MIDAVAEALDRMALGNRDPRPPVGDDGHQDHGLVQHHVVLDMVLQDRRSAVGDLGQPHAHARRPRHHHLVDVGDEAVERHRHVLQAMAHERRALAPTQHQYHHRAADGDREPAAVDDLQRVGGEKGRVDGAKDHDDEDCERGRPLPASDRHAIEQDGRDQHGPGHGDAVGAGQILRALE